MQKTKQQKIEIEYLPTRFPVWNAEAASVLGYCQGRGIDIGCGTRSLHAKMVRVDMNPDVKPDFVADAAELPFEAAEFDFMWSSHNLEHNAEPMKVIEEAKRVVKPGGYLVYIIPDKRYTAGLDPTHKVEWTPEEFVDGYLFIPGLQLVAFGVAAPKWSFHAVYEVLEATDEECKPCEEKAIKVAEAGLQGLKPRDLRRDPIRVSAIHDHPALTTGLGLVGRMILAGFQRALFRVSVLGCMHTVPAFPGEFPYQVQSVCEHDFYGYKTGLSFLKRTNPEVLFMLGDPGSLTQRMQSMFLLGAPLPIVVYFPIEGSPINTAYMKMIKAVQESGGRAITYTEWGAKAIEQQSDGELTVDWVHHGVDHAPFRPYPEEERKRLRHLIGWDGRFVVMNVSRNKRTNRHPAYIQAACLLKNQGYTDVLFYLHCDPLDPLAVTNMGGIDLKQMVEFYNVGDMVYFPPTLGDQLHGIPYHRLRRGDWQDLERPDTPEGRAYLFAHLSLIDIYNCADLYVDASSVQGFNLPNVEAMACGLPVIATDDEGVRREVLGDAASYFTVDATDYWHTGATLHLVSPEEIARHVRLIHGADGEMLAEMSAASLERAKLFKWKACQDRFIKAVKEVVNP